ncbi:MAG: DUF3429 domain-containing protein [Alphaproteobacteria bacterium]|nr:DUF3429 domain-containing protein [Alphaproteobacteria bacterium]
MSEAATFLRDVPKDVPPAVGPAPGGTSHPIPQPAAALGYLGALPIVVLAVAAWLGDAGLKSFAIGTEIMLGALLLVFIGGVRWGLAMAAAPGPGFASLAVSVVPALLVWGVLTVEDRAIQLGILIAAFLALLVSDLRLTARGGAPAWYPGLRVPLTVLVVGALGASLAALLIR